jgi:hypothetical protein
VDSLVRSGSLAAGLEPSAGPGAEGGSPAGRDPGWDQAGTAPCRAHPSPANLINASTRVLYDFARLKTDAAEQHAVANSLRSPLTPEQLSQRRSATFARLRMEAQLYSLRAAAARLTGKHWAAPCAFSLLTRSRARARCRVGALAPAPAAHVLASRWWCGPGTFLLRGSFAAVSRPLLTSCFSLCDL